MLACFVLPYLKKKNLKHPKYDESTPFCVNSIAIIFVLAHQSSKSRNLFSNALHQASDLNLKLCLSKGKAGLVQCLVHQSLKGDKNIQITYNQLQLCKEVNNKNINGNKNWRCLTPWYTCIHTRIGLCALGAWFVEHLG